MNIPHYYGGDKTDPSWELKNLRLAAELVVSVEDAANAKPDLPEWLSPEGYEEFFQSDALAAAKQLVREDWRQREERLKREAEQEMKRRNMLGWFGAIIDAVARRK